MASLPNKTLDGSKVTRLVIPNGDNQICFTGQGPNRTSTTVAFSTTAGLTVEASISDNRAIHQEPGADDPIWVDITVLVTTGILDIRFNLAAIRITNASGVELEVDVR